MVDDKSNPVSWICETNGLRVLAKGMSARWIMQMGIE